MQLQVNTAASVEENVTDAVVDEVEHPNVENELESAILNEIEIEVYQEMENSNAKFEEEPLPADMEDEKRGRQLNAEEKGAEDTDFATRLDVG